MDGDLPSGRVNLLEKTTRRRALALLGAGGAALLANQLHVDAAAAANGNPLILGAGYNVASDRTQLTATVADHALAVSNGADDGTALSGESLRGTGVLGVALDDGTPDPGIGVRGLSQVKDSNDWGDGAGTGVEGLSGSGSGVSGVSRTDHGGSFRCDALDTGVGCQGVSGGGEDTWGQGAGIGVQGLAGASGIGVHGTSDGGAIGGGPFMVQGRGIAVLGESELGVAVVGQTKTGTALYANAADVQGLALDIHGRAAFGTAGSGTVAVGRSDAFVSDPVVRATSHVTVTLVSDPGQRYVRWVQRVPGSGFRVHLTAAPSKKSPAIAFTYLIVEQSPD